MNWKNEAIDKLEQYDAKKKSLRTIPCEIERLEAVAHRIRSAKLDGDSVKNSGSWREDVLLSNIVEREELAWSLEQASKWVSIVEDGLSILDPEERLILDRFYIRGERGAADSLAGDLAVDVKTVYRRKDTALRRFTIALWGRMES